MRVAKLYLPGELMREHALRPDIRGLFSMFVVVGMEYVWHMDLFAYTVAALCFDYAEGGRIPDIEVRFEEQETEDGRIMHVRLHRMDGTVLSGTTIPWAPEGEKAVVYREATPSTTPEAGDLSDPQTEADVIEGLHQQ